MRHPRLPTPAMTDNSIAYGIINTSVKQHRMLAIGKCNMGDYHTNHHTGVHIQCIQPTYLHVEKAVAYTTEFNCPSGLQGCVKIDIVQTT
eukprot:13067674-Ditylum_brightwellii.AAC.1